VTALAALQVQHVAWWEVAGRLGLAAVMCGAVGLERELRGSAAGLRTHMLVGVGAALFTVAGAYEVPTDPTRVAAQVVTGIGFLGAGVIFTQRGSVRGLTTAASLWLTAAIGLAAGLGAYVALAAAVAVGLAVLGPLRLVELRWLHRDSTLFIAAAAGLDVDELLQALAPHGPHRLAHRLRGDEREISLQLRAPRGAIDDAVAQLSRHPGVIGVRRAPESDEQ
jgi:putative Mg2+ transporter-C (MgtC) family protein